MNHEKHINTKITLVLGDISSIWASQPEKVKLEIIRSIVYTSDDMHGFRGEIVKMLENEVFKDTLD